MCLCILGKHLALLMHVSVCEGVVVCVCVCVCVCVLHDLQV